MRHTRGNRSGFIFNAHVIHFHFQVKVIAVTESRIMPVSRQSMVGATKLSMSLLLVRHVSNLALASIKQAVPVVTLPFSIAFSAASLPLVAISIVVPKYL